jgi:ubiquinone/menaquinone biosynthesis C-methylase UbiE
MSGELCPWWLGYFLASPLRRLWHNPEAILGPHVATGMTVLEPGPGMGFFTLEIARRVGPTGRVIAVDVQPQMLARLRRRAAKAGLLDRIDIRQAPPERMNVDYLEGKVDFVLAFAVVHDLPDVPGFFHELHSVLKPRGKVLLAEPRRRVDAKQFTATLQAAERAGLQVVDGVAIPMSRSVVLAPASVSPGVVGPRTPAIPGA